MKRFCLSKLLKDSQTALSSVLQLSTRSWRLQPHKYPQHQHRCSCGKVPRVYLKSRCSSTISYTPCKANKATDVHKSTTVLSGREDHYDGVIIDTENLPLDSAEFSAALKDSLQHWRVTRKRGIWLKMTSAQAGALVQPAIDQGFDFHHAEPGHVILTKWLPVESSSKLPLGATHQVGVGAFLLNNKRQVLLVKENLGFSATKSLWKLPTGLSNLGEDVPDAAEREVFEETGIRARFHRVLAVRQSHGHNLGRSDIFFVCALRLCFEDQEIVIQKDELAAADWHDIDSADVLPIFQSGSMFKTIFRCCKLYADGTYSGLEFEKLPNGFNNRVDVLMHALPI